MDEDLARLIAPPPPPRPARRAEAIAAALERFDGDEPAARPVAPRASRWRARPGLVGAFASIALVAVVGIPMALDHRDAPSEVAPASRSVNDFGKPDARAAQGVIPPAAVVDAAPDAADVVAPSDRAAEAPPRVAARTEARTTPPEPVQMAEMIAPPPPPPPAPPAPPAPAPPAEAPQALAAAPQGSDDNAIVVTSARITRRPAAAAGRGDWNACTIDDPDQRLDRCKRTIRSAAGGDAAAAALGDGLTKAWQGDTAAAIAAFDRALAVKPRLALALLNRGLAYQQQGAKARAAADFDAAIRLERSARGYHARAQLRRQQGDTRGARQDEARAVALDEDYGALADD